jgi:hypothetical protein
MKFMEDWNNKSAEMVDVSLDTLQQQNQKTIGNFVTTEKGQTTIYKTYT